jgi:hypothetical protein
MKQKLEELLDSDLTDIELDAQYLAASTFTRLELEQLNQKP